MMITDSLYSILTVYPAIQKNVIKTAVIGEWVQAK